MNRNYKYKLCTNQPKAVAELDRWLETHRRLYNRLLGVCDCAWYHFGNKVVTLDNGKFNIEKFNLLSTKKGNKYSLSAAIGRWRRNGKGQNSFLTKVSASSLQQTFWRVNQTYQNFFRKLKNGEVTGVKFANEDKFRSFVYFSHNTASRYVKLNGTKTGRVILSSDRDTKTVIKFKYYRALVGHIKEIMFVKEIDGWYVVFSCENSVGNKSKREPEKIVGVDLGISKDNYLCIQGVASGDVTFEKAPKTFSKAKDQIRVESRSLVRKSKYNGKRLAKEQSNSRNKQKEHLAKVHQKVARKRKYIIDCLTKKLTDNNDIVVVEDLLTKDMIEKGYTALSRSLGDAALSKFTDILSYKAEEKGVVLHKVNPKDTTQQCSKCGWKPSTPEQRKTLNNRTHSCPACGLSIDRDINAARNILNRGLTDLGEGLAVALPGVYNLNNSLDSPESY